MVWFPILSAVLYEHLFRIIFMIILLCGSGFFSGSETAFFHLSPRKIRQFSGSKLRMERLIAKILQDPNQFLTALLFGNMLINVLYFAGSSTLVIKTAQQYGPVAGTVCGAVTFLLLLLFGEMLPKSIAYIHPRNFAMFASSGCYVILKVFKPVIRILDFVFVRTALRLFVGKKSDQGVSVQQLKLLLDASLRQGLITNDENQLLAEILKFSFLKVRHVMLARVNMPACAIDTPTKDVIKQMLQLRVNKLPVYTTGMDNIVGVVLLRDLFKNPTMPVGSMLKKVHYVPEQKTIESLIDFFKRTRSDHAVVVDEYGGVAGYVDLEDVMEQLLGPMEPSEEMSPIEQVGPLQYRIIANLPIYEWIDAFGIDITESRLTTIGGFVTALLGKIPCSGDKTRFKNMYFEVEKVQHNRIQSILLTLEPIAKSAKEASA